MSEDWEQSFLPLDNPNAIRPPAPKVTQCANAACGDLIHQDEAVKKDYFNGKTYEVEHFCSHSCHHTFYINHLRQWGM